MAPWVRALQTWVCASHPEPDPMPSLHYLQVTLPTNFSAPCAADGSCSDYPLSLATYYYSTDGSSVPTITGVLDGYPVISADLPPVTIVSGAYSA